MAASGPAAPSMSTAARGPTLTPRIACALSALDRACADLEGIARRSTRPRAAAPVPASRVRSERSALIAAEAARSAITLVRAARGVRGLASSLPVAISLIRAAGSQAHGPAPACGASLSEAASALGGVAVDAALVAGAGADYASCSAEAARALEGARLAVDSRLSRRYPKLDPAALGGAWA
ncbi:MAG: hypothetical protein OXU25_09320 [Thaumarchaeota archaeon]|nr:hypothetical protein [Nitrososphaerota archaeon]